MVVLRARENMELMREKEEKNSLQKKKRGRRLLVPSEKSSIPLYRRKPLQRSRSSRTAFSSHSAASTGAENHAETVVFLRNTLVRLLLGGAFFLNAVAWAVLFWGVSFGREVVVLHYNVYLGVDVTGTYREIYFVPATGLFFWLVNGLLARFLYTSQERIAAYMLLLAGVMIEFGVIIAAFSVVMVNY